MVMVRAVLGARGQQCFQVVSACVLPRVLKRADLSAETLEEPALLRIPQLADQWQYMTLLPCETGLSSSHTSELWQLGLGMLFSRSCSSWPALLHTIQNLSVTSATCVMSLLIPSDW